MAPYLKQGMSDGTEVGVCVRSDLGYEEDNPMSNSSPSPKDLKPRNSMKGTVTKNSSCVPKKIPKIIAPRFNIHGKCARCQSPHIVDEIIECNICNTPFHALCKDKSGRSSPDSICTRTFLGEVRPVIKKYRSNSNRWGNFMFACNHCRKLIQQIKTSHDAVTGEDAEVQTDLTTDTPINSDISDDGKNENSDDKTIASVSSIVTKNVQSMLSTLKEDLLLSIDNCVTSKLQSTLAIGSPLCSPLLRHRVPSSMSTACSEDSLLTSSSSSSIELSTPIDHSTTPSRNLLSSASSISMTSSEESDCNSTTPLSSSVETDRKSYQGALTSSVNLSSGFTPIYAAEKKIEGHTNVPANSPTMNDGSHILVLKAEDTSISLAKVESMAGDVLRNIPLTFMETHPKSGKVVVSFPKIQDKDKGKMALSESQTITEARITVSEAKKMFPKITVTNIPNSLMSDITAQNSNVSALELREKLKSFLEEKFLEKNETVRNLVSNEARTFKIVYVKSGRNYTTVGIKVSPDIRHMLMSQRCIYIGYTRCNVTDRFDVTQCFRCQRMGHKSDKCTERTVICKFCSASHTTGSCPYKDQKQKHRCTNCSHSNNEEHRDSCNSHHSGEDVCPIIQQEKDKLRQRTEYSKNM